ncbi:MAG: hypothetical protein QHC79_09540 [Pseudosphingobacterium sp.]|uniref:Uncharacterized protein n=1 Tax=Sphingobacterium sp. (strain 21) TaxID=743722 RepID=F4C2C7_SPHS2|nr:hypothetical protein [Pseudosphingobacterium sp.]
MKTLLITLVGIVLLTSPIGKAASVPEPIGPNPIDEAAQRASEIDGKIKELDSLLMHIR